MNDFVLVCSVGGSPEPIRKSICLHEPRYVLYVASASSRKTIRQEIERGLDWHGIEDTHTHTLSDSQDLLACVRDMRAGIAEGLRAMSLAEDCLLIADITGGTKVMSAALTLVMMEYPNSRFAYVGGDTRSKNGLGVVESGHECFLKQDNPWEVMALREVRQLANFFNAGDFAAALSLAGILAQKVSGKEKFYGAVTDMVKAFTLWDAFEHEPAANTLRQALGKLTPFAGKHGPLQQLLGVLRTQQDVLEEVRQDAAALKKSQNALTERHGQAYLRDLLANAARRDKAGRYDDAVARLYSALEKSAKIRLQSKYGLDNSNIQPEQLPESLPPELRAELLAQQQREGIIRIPLQKSFYLLAALDDPLGREYLRCETELHRLLDIRNHSLLGHGYVPVNADTCQKLFNMALRFLAVNEEELPRFPTLDWRSLLL